MIDKVAISFYHPDSYKVMSLEIVPRSDFGDTLTSIQADGNCVTCIADLDKLKDVLMLGKALHNESMLIQKVYEVVKNG